MSRQTLRYLLLTSVLTLIFGAGWLGGKMTDPLLVNAEGVNLMAGKLGFGDAPAIDFKLLSKAHVETDTGIVFPEALKKLDGKTVTLTGFMAPYDSIDDMTTALVMPTNVGCFFCQPPSLDQVALIMQKKRGKHPSLAGPVIAVGTLRLQRNNSTQSGRAAEFLYVIDEAEVHSLKDGGDSLPARPSHAPGHARGSLPNP